MSDDDVTEEEAGRLDEYVKYQARLIERYRDELRELHTIATEILTLPVRPGGIIVSVATRRRLQVAVHGEPAKKVRPAKRHPLFADCGDGPNPTRSTPRPLPGEESR